MREPLRVPVGRPGKGVRAGRRTLTRTWRGPGVGRPCCAAATGACRRRRRPHAPPAAPSAAASAGTHTHSAHARHIAARFSSLQYGTRGAELSSSPPAIGFGDGSGTRLRDEVRRAVVLVQVRRQRRRAAAAGAVRLPVARRRRRGRRLLPRGVLHHLPRVAHGGGGVLGRHDGRVVQLVSHVLRRACTKRQMRTRTLATTRELLWSGRAPFRRCAASPKARLALGGWQGSRRGGERMRTCVRPEQQRRAGHGRLRQAVPAAALHQAVAHDGDLADAVEHGQLPRVVHQQHVHALVCARHDA